MSSRDLPAVTPSVLSVVIDAATSSQDAWTDIPGLQLTLPPGVGQALLTLDVPMALVTGANYPSVGFGISVSDGEPSLVAYGGISHDEQSPDSNGRIPCTVIRAVELQPFTSTVVTAQWLAIRDSQAVIDSYAALTALIRPYPAPSAGATMPILSVTMPSPAQTSSDAFAPIPGLTLTLPPGTDQALVILDVPYPFAKGDDYPGANFGIEVDGTSIASGGFTYDSQQPDSSGRRPITVVAAVPLDPATPRTVQAIWSGVRGSTAIIDSYAALFAVL